MAEENAGPRENNSVRWAELIVVGLLLTFARSPVERWTAPHVGAAVADAIGFGVWTGLFLIWLLWRGLRAPRRSFGPWEFAWRVALFAVLVVGASIAHYYLRS